MTLNKHTIRDMKATELSAHMIGDTLRGKSFLSKLALFIKNWFFGHPIKINNLLKEDLYMEIRYLHNRVESMRETIENHHKYHIYRTFYICSKDFTDSTGHNHKEGTLITLEQLTALLISERSNFVRADGKHRYNMEESQLCGSDNYGMADLPELFPKGRIVIPPDSPFC